MKIERTCPRCRARRYHPSTAELYQARPRVEITCAECAHRWIGRLSRVERDMETED